MKKVEITKILNQKFACANPLQILGAVIVLCHYKALKVYKIEDNKITFTAQSEHCSECEYNKCCTPKNKESVFVEVGLYKNGELYLTYYQ